MSANRTKLIRVKFTLRVDDQLQDTNDKARHCIAQLASDTAPPNQYTGFWARCWARQRKKANQQYKTHSNARHTAMPNQHARHAAQQKPLPVSEETA